MNQPVNRPGNRTASTDGAHSLGERKKKGWLLWLILGLLILAALAIWAIVHNRNNDDDKSSDTTIAAITTTLASSTGAVVTTAGPPTTVTATVPATATTAASAGGVTPTTARATTTQTAPTTAATATTATAGGGVAPTTATIPPAPGPTTPLAANGQDLVAISTTSGTLSGLVGQPAAGQAVVQSVVSDEGFWVGTSAQNRVFVFLSTEARGSSGESPFQVAAGQTVEIAGTMVSTDGRIPADVTAADGLQQLTDQHALINATSLKLVK